jgi:uncharacterized protein (DUF111 family)
MLTETTTIGVRLFEAGRVTLERKTVKVRTKYGEIPVKLSRMPDGGLNVSPEYDDCARAARHTGAPIKLVYEEARGAAHKHASIS